MQKPGHKVDLAKTEAEVRLTTGLEESTKAEFRVKTEGEATTQQEFRIATQTGMEVELDDGFHSDRMLDSGTDTHTETGTSTRSETQSETRQKTQSGELSSLERHADPDGTIGCNTCQEDLIDAISEHCKINVGDVIASRYEIKTYLGEGGMSAVYAAVDKVIKRDVALKILHRDLLVRGKGSLLRFQREAQALGNLDHPNIVKIHHFDADENAQPYIVMDIVQGEPLARRLVKNPESVKFSDIIDIFVQVCDALSHAHSRGVVHRDLKPSNIMVIGNHVKVLDFGIAKLMSEDSDQELQLTRTGEVFGSPLYMSPEQCRGLKLDFRSDIYSIGCVMYEAFTGNPPFTGNSHIDTMLKHVNDLPASVSTSMCDARYVEKVDAILLRCMAKNPNARFQSMDEVKAALLELDRETKGPIERFKQKLELIKLKLGAQGKLTKKMIAAYSAAGFIVMGLAATALVQHNNSVLQVDSKNASIERWKELDEKGQADFNSGKYQEAEAIFRGELDMAKRLKNRQLSLASSNEILDLLNAQKYLTPGIASRSDFKEKVSHVKEEIVRIQAQEIEEVSGLKRDLESAGALTLPEKQALCNRALDTALAISDAGRHQVGLDILKAAMPIVQGTKDEVLQGKAHQTLGRAYESAREINNAKEEFETALKIRDRVLPKDDADIARSLIHLSRLLPLEESKPLLDRARNICTRAFSPTSHQVASIDLLMSNLQFDAGQFRMSLQNAESAISKCKSAVETQLNNEERFRATQTLVRSLIFRARANREILNADLRRGGKVADKEQRENAIKQDFSEALTYAESLNPKPNASEIDMLMSWLLAEDAKGLKQQYELEMSKNGNVAKDIDGKPVLLNEARIKLARALAINERLPSAEMTKKASNYYWWLGKVSRAMLDFPFAEKMYKQAKEMSERALGVNNPESIDIQNELNAVIRDSGKNKK